MNAAFAMRKSRVQIPPGPLKGLNCDFWLFQLVSCQDRGLPWSWIRSYRGVFHVELDSKASFMSWHRLFHVELYVSTVLTEARLNPEVVFLKPLRALNTSTSASECFIKRLLRTFNNPPTASGAFSNFIFIHRLIPVFVIS
jgi:hypothetical protein